MEKLKCIHPRKAKRFMREFADRAIWDTPTDLVKTVFIKGKYFAAFLYDYYPDGVATISYSFENIQNDGQKQFRQDFTSRCKAAKGFADITICILHEVGHFAVEEVTRNYNRCEKIRELQWTIPQATINFEYFKLPDEKAATDWAINWLSIPENRKIAKQFEKKFFSCFQGRA